MKSPMVVIVVGSCDSCEMVERHLSAAHAKRKIACLIAKNDSSDGSNAIRWAVEEGLDAVMLADHSRSVETLEAIASIHGYSVISVIAFRPGAQDRRIIEQARIAGAVVWEVDR